MADLFAGRFFSSFVILTLLFLIISGIKKLLEKTLSSQVHYLLWMPFLISLAVPFLPACLWDKGSWYALLNFTADSARAKVETGFSHSDLFPLSSSLTGIQDFSVSVSGSCLSSFFSALFLLWAAGAAVMGAGTFASYKKISRIKKTSMPLENQSILLLYKECEKELKIRKQISIRTTPCLTTPASCGFFRPAILLPLHAVSDLPREELRCILLHELAHLKNRDTLINFLACLAQIVYWHHPLVWLALKQMRRDCETACDSRVLSLLSREERLSYGTALLRFTAKASRLPYTAVSAMSGTAKELKGRLLHIKDFQKDSAKVRKRSVIVLLISSLLILLLSPAMTAGAWNDTQYDASQLEFTEADFSSFFQGYEGSFVLYDKNKDQLYIYNQNMAVRRVSPDSTYKIYSGLAALDQGIITPEGSHLSWDGTPQPFESWNRDQDLSSALKNSVNWYFRELDNRTGILSLQKILSAINYGNENLSGGQGKYWLESSLKISPLEQTELLIRLCNETLPFHPQSMKAVKNALFLYETDTYSLYGKTGTGIIDNREQNGWFVGFAVTADNTYVFTANIQGKDFASGTAAVRITEAILKKILVP